MDYQKIITELRKYYPFGISFMDNEYELSEQFKYNRMVLKNQYFAEQENIENIKQELCSVLNSEIEVYSFAAGHFCHHFTFFIENNRELYYSLLISSIIPYYTIRIVNSNNWETDFSTFGEKFPEKAKLIEGYVAKHFLGYQIIADDDLLNRPIEGVEVDESNHPTLLMLAFTSILA